MEEPNVNNLNGIGNFGHGMPEDGVVIAGVTDTTTESIEPAVESAPVGELVEDTETEESITTE